jgi:hypothetical protein
MTSWVDARLAQDRGHRDRQQCLDRTRLDAAEMIACMEVAEWMLLYRDVPLFCRPAVRKATFETCRQAEAAGRFRWRAQP